MQRYISQMQQEKEEGLRIKQAAVRVVATWSNVTTAGCLSFGLIEKYLMFSVTFACARRTGAASQSFERMHNTLSHRVKT